MKVLLIVDERDVAVLQERVVEGSPPHPLPGLIEEPHEVDFALVVKGRLVDQQNLEITQDVLGHYCTVAFPATPNMEVRKFKALITKFVRGEQVPPANNPAVIVLSLDQQVDKRRGTIWEDLPPERTFIVPTIVLPGADDAPSAWVSAARTELAGLLDSFDESQTLNPNVGFGLLLIASDSGRFFLRERHREPGKGKLGTIGGNFERNKKLQEQLHTTLNERFGPKFKSKNLTLGPMLACTNMRHAYYHYIDLTFLATSISEWSDVSDPQLVPVNSELLEELFPHRDRPSNTYFTFEEMVTLFTKEHLFLPVANAFEALCRQILAESALSGWTDAWHVRAWGGELLEIPLQLDRKALEGAFKTLPGWQDTTLPFFESDLP